MLPTTRPPSPTLEAHRLEVLADRLTLEERIERAADTKEQVLAQVLLNRHRELGDRVAGEIVAETCKRWTCCLDGLDALTERLVELRAGQPFLRGDLSLRLPRSLLDEDLLTSASAAMFHHGRGAPYSALDAGMLLNDPLPPALDRDLEVLLEGPLAETHVHLGGAAPPITLWLPLMLGLLSVEQAAVMAAEAARFETREVRSIRELTDLWLARLLEAGTLRWRIAARLPRCTGDRGHPFMEVRGLWESPVTKPEGGDVLDWLRCFRWWLDRIGARRSSSSLPLDGCPIQIDPGGELPYRDCLTLAVEKQLGLTVPCEAPALGERYLLASALRYLRGRDGPNAATLRADVLRYIRIKNAFLRRLIHYPGIHGLDRFRDRFARGDRAKRYLDGGRTRRYLDDRSRSREVWLFACVRYQVRMTVLRWLDAGTRQRLLSEPPTSHVRAARARRILRASVRELERRLELRFSPGRGTILGRMLLATAQGVRDALSALQRNGDTDGEALPLPRFQIGVVLHLIKSRWRSPADYAEILNGALLWFDDRPAWRPFLVGVDAAGSELDSPPSCFAAAFAGVDRWRSEGTWRRYGIRLSLGKTFHVGEDFRDLLTGVRQVDVAVRSLGLVAGDRLGHALAVGFAPELWYRKHPRCFPRIGDHLLDLLWAWNLLRKAGDVDAIAAVESRLQVCDVGEPGNLVSIDAWLEQLPDDEDRDEATIQAELVEQTRPGRGVDELVELVPDDRWIKTLRRLQGLVAEQIDRRGLVIEANPTSNLLISGLDEFTELPLYRQHPVRAASGDRVGPVPLRVSVSTDDPEVFRVNLREEYCALFEASRADDGRVAVLEWLDKLRVDSFESSFLNRESPVGAELLELLELVTNGSRR